MLRSEIPCKSINNHPRLITDKESSNGRRELISTILTTSLAIGGGLQVTHVVLAEAWGTRSFIKERIKQIVEGLHSIREILDTMSWRYFDSYIWTPKVYESYLYYEKTMTH
ncbi:hypothetical protein MKX01_024542 [Papaver californicum]|nr:hypothetical protein MKX01_024542 [Papaver californicum]